MCSVEHVISAPSVSPTPTLLGLPPSGCKGLPPGPGLALIRPGEGLSGPLSALFLEAGLQLDADAGVAAVQSLEEEVGVLLQLLQVGLGAPVLPVQLFGAESDVQQARLAQNVVGVAEALPLYVSAALAGIRLHLCVLLGVPPGDREALGGGGGRRGGADQLRLADGWWRLLSDRAAATAAGFSWVGTRRKSRSGNATFLLLVSLAGLTAALLWPRGRGGRGCGSSPRGAGAIAGVRSDLRVGLQDWKVIFGPPVSGRDLFGGRGSLTRHYRLEKDHLRLLDHLHGGAEPPGFEGRRIVPRLQKK